MLNNTIFDSQLQPDWLLFSKDSITKESIALPLFVGVSTILFFVSFLQKKRKTANEKNGNVQKVSIVSGGLPLLGHAIKFGSDTENFLRSCKEKYGRSFQVNIMGRKMVFLDGTFRQDFFTLPEKTLSFKEMTIQTLAPEYTFGMDTVMNPYHLPIIRRQFVGKNLQQYLSRIEKQVKNVISANIGNLASKEGKIVDNCEILAWKIIASCSASSFLGDDISKSKDVLNVFIEYHKACYGIINAASILPKKLLWLCSKSLKKQEDIIKKVVVPEVISRRKMIKNDIGTEDLPHDFLSHLAKLRHSPDDIAKRMMAFIFASMITSAGALTHAIYDLAGRDKEWGALLKEQDGIMKKHGKELSKDALDDMPQLHAFIWESMRHAALPIQQARLAAGKGGVVLRSQTNNKINSVFIPEGASILMSGYLSGMDETTVERSNEFWPGRFLVTGEDNDGPAFTSDPASTGFFPFGIGRHHCPGRQFALSEIKGALCVLLRTYKFRTLSGEIPKYKRIPADTLRINEPVQFHPIE